MKIKRFVAACLVAIPLVSHAVKLPEKPVSATVHTSGGVELFDTTDVNWVKGLARKGAGFFVANNPANEKEILVGYVVRFADGQEREILRVDKNERYLYVTISGDTLDAQKVGFPNKVVVLKKNAQKSK